MSELTLFDHQSSELKEKIRQILIDQPETRDNDNLLLSIIWGEDIYKCKIGGLYTDAHWFLKLLADPENKGELTSFKSIVRYRSMLQSEFPYLQGKTYRKRKEDSKNISKEIAATGTV